MNEQFIVAVLGIIVAESSPLVFASIGETLSEKAGVINLSLDGTILLSAMAGFAMAYLSGSVFLGFTIAAMVGASIAFLVAFSSIELTLDQVAIGFVLTLATTDLSSFLGNRFVRIPGPTLSYQPVPLLGEIPFLGRIFFQHNVFVYAGFVLVVAAWYLMFKTRQGLQMRAVGERPKAAFVRGVNVNKVRYLYTIVGGALVGLAGAGYSLAVKPGWSYNHTLGMGWIALAIVIFGGWHPIKVAGGACLFGALQSVGSLLQDVIPGMPSHLIQSIPFVVMILLLVISSKSETLDHWISLLPGPSRSILRSLLRVTPPAGLGKRLNVINGLSERTES